MTTVIKVENLGKKYLIGHEKEARYETLRDSLSHGVKSMANRLMHPLQPNTEETDLEEFWALKDINFEIQQGDKVGIIGRNGAGKSTLLKILSRITAPTTGKVTLKGRVASLLEVGTGFHPELSGRENIYLNGAILGMRKAEIKRKFDEIVEFAEIEKFLDTPVKRYSSGMYVRLAFAVAAHLDPEILVVDEVLAVGDIEFQAKCLGKMNEVSKIGRTVLFVSHNMAAISNLCSKALLLHNGCAIAMGNVSHVTLEYLKSDNCNKMALPAQKEELIIHEFDINQGGAPVDHVDGDKSFNINIVFELLEPLTAFRIGVYLKLVTGETIFRSFLADWEPKNEFIDLGKYEVKLTVPPKLLFPGNYKVILHASRYGIKDYLDKNNIHKEISILQPHKFNQGHINETFHSFILMPQQWLINKL
ncbi:ABC transporter ATP-binding protein [Methylomonas sp. MgM2]